MAIINKGVPNSIEKLDDRQFQSLINSFNDEFFWFNDDSEIIHFSENFSKVTGFTLDELKSLDEIIYLEDRFSYRKAHRSALDNLSKELELEFRITTKDDKIKWVKESIKIFYDDSGKVIRFIGRVKEVTPEKLIEIALTEVNSELKDQNTAKDSFLNLLSHDLRSPFTSILGFTEILLKEKSLTEVERNEYLTYLYSSSEKLLKLINYLLDWSRLRSGKLQLERQKIDLHSLIYSCVSSLTGKAIRKNIEIKIEADKFLKIFGDERLLNIVITNLISNAIKFSNNESKIIIKAEKFNSDFIELVVIDKGIGIPEKSKINLFKIENLFSTTGTAGERGTGFCLTLSKEIIQKHGGEIWFYSEEAKGSEFHITIPASPNIILIIETDTNKLNTITSTIKKIFKNFKVINACNANEALHFTDNLPPSVIILSHEFPLMNGMQILENITRNKNNSELKVIVYNDSFTPKLKNDYEKFGKVIFIERTSLDDQLINALKELVK